MDGFINKKNVVLIFLFNTIVYAENSKLPITDLTNDKQLLNNNNNALKAGYKKEYRTIFNIKAKKSKTEIKNLVQYLLTNNQGFINCYNEALQINQQYQINLNFSFNMVKTKAGLHNIKYLSGQYINKNLIYCLTKELNIVKYISQKDIYNAKLNLLCGIRYYK